MIRPLTVLSLLAAGFAGVNLYRVKHEVSTMERELRDIGRQTEAARERTAVLRAEWALLNEPERLRAAAIRHLPLETMQTAQFVRSNEMERRLPTAVAFAGAPSLFAAGGTMVAAVTPAAAAAAVASTTQAPGAPASAATAPNAPAPTAAAQPAAPNARPGQAASGSAPVTRAPTPVQVASAPAREAARPAPRHVESARAPVPAPEPIRRAPDVVQAAAPPAPTLRPAIYLAPAQRAPEPAIAAGSVLGGASRPTLAPPVPFGAAQAATPAR